ncbi:hypothetical protein M378DRAFT_70614 [Amanita muscaria Koide BX008]|uniref:Uncharacterized protein n=1 Tax=Amanita muscaria (strain Koide BX008) TaxID=946122 RepID=A0A0C2TNR5_AMAMK|nr:hypothetical protein M378DRAFT_70614 [Amanita muscaria Koide BX008]
MTGSRRTALISIAVVLALGIGYSVLYNTYLDTSDPLLAHLPHPLSKSHYFASKSNILNVYFIKQGWGWTTIAFLLNWLTSPPETRTRQRFYQYLLATASWFVFAMWFFGPALLERVIVGSGGECLLYVPSGEHFSVPHTLCYSRTTIAPATHPDLFASPAFAALSIDNLVFPDGWKGVPRLRKGHDVSGHVFLVTLAILLLVDQLRPSFYVRRQQGQQWSLVHYVAVVANVALIAVWFLAIYTTGVYFHSPMEKVTGFVLGVLCFLPTQLPSIQIRFSEKKHTN